MIELQRFARYPGVDENDLITLSVVGRELLSFTEVVDET